MKTYDYFMDSQHGWIKVSKEELRFLGIANDITRHSYMRGNFAYLEEDCDAGAFVKAYMKKYGFGIQTRARYSKYSRIRNYSIYSA